jgi:hypothetical protein
LLGVIRRKGGKGMFYKSDTSSVLTLATNENDNLTASLSYLGDTYNLVFLLDDAYARLRNCLAVAGRMLASPNNSLSTLAIFISVSHTCLTRAILAILRGHFGQESKVYMRKAIECCAFARKIGLNPELATIWFKGMDSEEEFTRFRKAFKKSLFPPDDELMVVLYEEFDACSKAIHSSVLGIGPMFAPLINPNIDANKLLVRLFMLEVFHHGHILMVYERLVRTFAGDDINEWNAAFDRVQAVIEEHSEKWLQQHYDQ